MLKNTSRGTWVTQSVKHPIFDLSSGLDLRVVSSISCWLPHWAWSLLKNKTTNFYKKIEQSYTCYQIEYKLKSTENNKRIGCHTS